MPGFVKTPKDEARWKRAKEAAGKQTSEGSESFYKLSNYIYHKMGKTEEDQKMSELYKNEITNDFQSGKELNVENLRHFLMSVIPAQQSILSNEVENMSDEKKYTAREAAVAVLAKAEEVLKKSELLKSTGHEKGVHASHGHGGKGQKGISEAGEALRISGGNKNISNPTKRGLHNAAVGEHKAKLGELKAMPKPNLTKSDDKPKSEIHPKEPQAGESENPGNRIHGQAAPQNNPKEQAEGNNELAGTTPNQVGQDGKNLPGHDEQISGHLKLAKFIGRMHAKRKTPPGGM